MDNNNRKLSGFYTVEQTQQFASENMFPCHVVRVINGNTIILYLPYKMHPVLKIIRVRIKGISTTNKKQQATAFIKNAILKGQKILYLNPRWDMGKGQVIAEVFIDGESLADKLINQGYACKKEEEEPYKLRR